MKWMQNRNKFRQGKYLVKVYVDSTEKIKKAPELLLGEEDFAGKVVIEQAKWQLGFPKAETVSGKNLQE